jgi:ABC-type nickel/cobalt efflux system permease component RcnA
MTLVVAMLLGLRHATDPDHLTAISTLFLSENHNAFHRATTLGLAWGLGHAATLFAFGLPVVLFSRSLPESIQRGAEVLVGFLIVLLALRLLVRWHRGYFHAHTHSHAGIRHAHPHVHENRGGSHAHPVQHIHSHADVSRSPLAAFGIGLVHGIGGSAGVGVLLMTGVAGKTDGVLALLVFAAATALSMAAVSAILGYTMGREVISRRLARLVPVLGGTSLIFGVWYSLGALQSQG